VSTPNSSSGAGGAREAGRLRVGRYVLVTALGLIGFLAVAMVEEREVFKPLFGLESALTRAPRPRVEAGAHAVARVRAFNEALEAAYAAGSVAALSAELAAPAVGEALAAEAAYARGRGEPPLGLARARVARVEPTGAGTWAVWIDEVWAPGGEAPADAPALRLRYGLAPGPGGALRVASMAADPAAPGASHAPAH